MSSIVTDKKFILFLVVFIAIFLCCYVGTLVVIGLASPGNYYSSFIATYLDYVSGIKNTLLHASQFLLSIFGFHADMHEGFVLRKANGRGVIIAMDCVGFGVYSFWIAYVVPIREGCFQRYCGRLLVSCCYGSSM